MSEVVNCGDWKMIKLLSDEYKQLLDSKEVFLELILKRPINNYERIEAEVSLACLTGRIKAVDASIHHLMFGSEIIPETSPRSIEYQMKLNQGERMVFLEKRVGYMDYLYNNKVDELLTVRKKLYNANYRIKQLESAIKKNSGGPSPTALRKKTSKIWQM